MYSRNLKRKLKKNLQKLGLDKLTKILYYVREIRKPFAPNPLFDKKLVKKIAKYYGGNHGQNVCLKTGNLGFGLIHYSLIINHKPKQILCVGSEKGFVPAMCALACKANLYGQVDFVDAGFNLNQPNNWGGTGFWKNNDPNQHFSFLGLDKYINTFVMTTKNFTHKFKQEKYDYIYLDGDHSYLGVKKDFEFFWPRLKKNGFMLFHDIGAIGSHQGKKFGVKKFWDDLKTNHQISFYYAGGATLGILQKE